MKSWASKQNSQKSIIMREKHNLDSFCHPYKMAFKWVYFVILIIVLLCSLIASCLIMYSAFIHLFICSNGLHLNGGERTGNNYKCGSHYDRSKCRVQWEPRERCQGWIARGCSPILTSVSLFLIDLFRNCSCSLLILFSQYSHVVKRLCEVSGITAVKSPLPPPLLNLMPNWIKYQNERRGLN